MNQDEKKPKPTPLQYFQMIGRVNREKQNPKLGEVDMLFVRTKDMDVVGKKKSF